MRNPLRRTALILALVLACAPLAWQQLVVPSAEAQFQAWTQAATLQNAVTGTAVGATLDTSGAPIVTFQSTISSGASNAITFQGSLDGVNWSNLGCFAVGSSTVEAITGNNPGPLLPLVRCDVVGIPLVRANITTSSAGTITVKAYATQSYFPLGTNTP